MPRGVTSCVPRVNDGTRCSGVPSPRRSPMLSAAAAGVQTPVFCSRPMKNVLIEYAAPESMLKVPAPVELFTVYFGNATPVLQSVKPSNVLRWGDSMYS